MGGVECLGFSVKIGGCLMFLKGITFLEIINFETLNIVYLEIYIVILTNYWMLKCIRFS